MVAAVVTTTKQAAPPIRQAWDLAAAKAQQTDRQDRVAAVQAHQPTGRQVQQAAAVEQVEQACHVPHLQAAP